ncbi:hypothetical protein [Streptomyces sp. NPDC050145]|uniref:hypothetical protein n=1 Tax=Streptomyces sp. NPDC050145 TaxID=3365602 RepID=UPI0037A81BC4
MNQGAQYPGGGHNPQEPNPYTPTAPSFPQQYNAPTQGAMPPAPPAPGGPPKKGGGRTVAAVIAVLVALAAVTTTGIVLLTNDDDKNDAGPTAPSASDSADSSARPSSNPRRSEGPQPTVDGWKVVANPTTHIAFDVPPEWGLKSPSWVAYTADEDDTSDTPLVAFQGPAYLQEKWCTDDVDQDGTKEDTALAGAGSRRNQDSESADQAARHDSSAWVYGLYAQPDRKKVRTSPVESYTTASGISGRLASSWSSGADKRHKCATDGKSTTFAFKNPQGKVVSWSFIGAQNVKDEVDDATVRKILRTVRLYRDAPES